MKGPIVLQSATAGPRRLTFREFQDMVSPPDHFSWSQLSVWSECQAQWAFSRTDTVPERPAWWNIGGTAVHATFERLALWDRSVCGPESAFETEFNKEISLRGLEWAKSGGSGKTSDFRAAKKGVEGEDFWRSIGPDLVRNALHLLQARQAEGWEIAAVELPMEFNCAEANRCEPDDPYMIRVRPDLVLARGNQNLVVDLKTGSKMPLGFGQLATATLAIVRGGKEGRRDGVSWAGAPDEVYGQFWPLRRPADTRLPVQLGGDEMAMVLARYRNVEQARLDSISPRPGDHCWWCRFKDLCPALG